MCVSSTKYESPALMSLQLYELDFLSQTTINIAFGTIFILDWPNWGGRKDTQQRRERQTLSLLQTVGLFLRDPEDIPATEVVVCRNPQITSACLLLLLTQTLVDFRVRCTLYLQQANSTFGDAED